MKFNLSDVTTHASVDQSDPGFALKGHKLRWISGHVESRRAGRIWQVLKGSMLPDKIMTQVKGRNPSWFRDGDAIRKGDLTLAFAPMAEVEAKRATNKDQQSSNEAVFRKGQRLRGQAVTDDSSMRTVTQKAGGAGEFS